MLKKILLNVLFGIGFGSALLNFTLLISNLVGADNFFNALVTDYPRQSVAYVAVAVVFALLSIVYESEKLSMGMQVLIHMGGGLLFYFTTAALVNWMPTHAGIAAIIGNIVFGIIVSFIIWAIFYFYHRNEVKQINKKLSSLNK